MLDLAKTWAVPQLGRSSWQVRRVAGLCSFTCPCGKQFWQPASRPCAAAAAPLFKLTLQLSKRQRPDPRPSSRRGAAPPTRRPARACTAAPRAARISGGTGGTRGAGCRGGCSARRLHTPPRDWRPTQPGAAPAGRQPVPGQASVWRAPAAASHAGAAEPRRAGMPDASRLCQLPHTEQPLSQLLLGLGCLRGQLPSWLLIRRLAAYAAGREAPGQRRG